MDLKIGSEPCEHCAAAANGDTVLVLRESQRDLLHSIIEQVREGIQQGAIASSATEQMDLADLQEMTRIQALAGR